MRTMFISLVFIWSLAQLAWAEGPPPPLPVPPPITPEDCGTIYQCFAPEICDPSSTVTAGLGEIEEIKKNKQIKGDCPVLIRLHQEGLYKLHINLKSYSATPDYIEFVQKKQNGAIRNKFSCERDADGKQIAKHADKEKENTDPDPQDGKLDCVFSPITKKATGESILYGENSDPVSFKIRNTGDAALVETRRYSHNINSVRCNPKNLRFQRETTTAYHQIKVKTLSPGKYGCEDPDLYKKEYRKDRTSPYIELTSIACIDKGEMFVINNDVDNPVESIDIRCAAETKFLCKNDVKRKYNEDEPKFATDSVAGVSLKCPPEKPHLVIVESIDKYIIDPEFECTLIGSVQLWQVRSEGKVHRLTQKGPEIYCTDKIKCQTYHAIPDNIVEDGTLDQHFLPKCFSKGVLKTMDKKEVTTRCDDSIGKFKYTAGGEEQIMDDNTKFFCDFLLVVIVILVRKGYKKENQKRAEQCAAQQANAFQYYTRGEKEKADARKREKESDKGQTQSISIVEKSKLDEKPKEETWNSAVTSLQCMNMTKFAQADGAIAVKVDQKDSDACNYGAEKKFTKTAFLKDRTIPGSKEFATLVAARGKKEGPRFAHTMKKILKWRRAGNKKKAGIKKEGKRKDQGGSKSETDDSSSNSEEC